MKISKTAGLINQSLTRELFDKAKTYDDVIDFTLGDPDFPTPQKIREAGCKAINNGKINYSENAGLPELRDEIAKKIKRECGISYNPKNEIIATVGAMQGLLLCLECILNEGDEVIIPAPYWINYRQMVQMCKGKPVIIDAYESDDFIIKAQAVKNAITNRTSAIILNSPNNPTGAVYDRKTLDEILKLAKENDILIIWDECYKSLVYEEEFAPLLTSQKDKDSVILVNSCSKEYAMTGWRLGYIAANSEIICAMTALQENMVACAPLVSQYAAIEAFRCDSSINEDMRECFKRRRDLFVNGINEIQKLSCRMPKGTFYAMVNIKQTGLDSVQFANTLLEKKQVAVVPGITYGDCCEGYVRVAYTISEEKISEGIKRISEFIKEL